MKDIFFSVMISIKLFMNVLSPNSNDNLYQDFTFAQYCLQKALKKNDMK